MREVFNDAFLSICDEQHAAKNNKEHGVVQLKEKVMYILPNKVSISYIIRQYTLLELYYNVLLI